MSVLEYEQIGPSSVSSVQSGKSNQSSGSMEVVERKDENGDLMVDKDGNVIRWRVKRRHGHRRRRRPSQAQVKGESEDGEEYEDNRMGDAEDRVIDIQHLLSTGVDIDTEDHQ